MTNAEKHKDAIIAQMCKTGRWGVNKANEIISCDVCYDCIFKNGLYCYEERKEWLNAEADEKKVFSEKDKEVLRALDKVQWVARNEDGILYGAYKKPCRVVGVWCCAGDYITNLTTLTTAEFAPVTREDYEPTSREEILGDEK